MSYEELCDYENKNGYYSVARKSEEVYLLANPENFNSKKELFKFVEENSDYIEFVTDDNNEVSLEVKNRLNANRYIVGDAGLYRINNTVYKLIGNGTCCTSIKNVDEIKKINVDNYSDYVNDKRFSFSSGFNANERWGSETDYETSTSGKNRVKIEYLFDSTNNLLLSGDPNYYPYSYIRLNCVTKSQNKVFGIWFNCRRTMSMSVDAKLVVKYQNQWRGYLYDRSANYGFPEYNIVFYKTIPMTDVNGGGMIMEQYQAVHLERMYFWGDNNAGGVNPAVISIGY